MSAIPLHDLDQVATKGDIALLRAELQSDMYALSAKVEGLTAVAARADAKLDRLVFVLIAGLFAVIATLIGVGLSL